MPDGTIRTLSEIETQSVVEGASIDAKYLDFVCQTALENPDKTQWATDLNEVGRGALKAEYGNETIPSGHLETTVPEEINQNDEYHSFVDARVDGVKIHSIGKLTIGEEKYIYYTTNSTTPTCSVYNVLRWNNDNDNDNDNQHITLNYEHMTGQLIRYSVKSNDDGLPDDVNSNSVFGSHPAMTTEENGTVAFPVTIPRGYTGTVKGYFVKGTATEDGTMTFPEDPEDTTDANRELVALSSDKTETEGSEEGIILGAMRKYTGEGNTQKLKMEANETDALTDTVHVVPHEDHEHHPGKTRLYVVVTLEKNTGPLTFDATPWLKADNVAVSKETRDNTSPKDPEIVWDFGRKGDNLTSGKNTLEELENLSEQSINKSGKINIDDNGTATLTFRALTTFLSGVGGNVEGGLNDGYAAWSLNLLEINGEQVKVPVLPDFNNGDYPLSKTSFTTKKEGKPGSETRFDDYIKEESGSTIVETSADTTLSTGTKITVKVKGELLKAKEDVIGKETQAIVDDYAYFRTYTIEVENCQEDLTVTGLNFVKDSLQSLTLSTRGVTDVQVWNHPQWEDRDNLASWKEANNVQNRIIDRSNSNWNAKRRHRCAGVEPSSMGGPRQPGKLERSK